MNLRKNTYLAALMVATAGLLFPTGALAAQTHAFEKTFGGPGAGAGQLSLLAAARESAGSGVAVDDATGDVYVADTGNNRIDEFEADGTFIRAFGWGVKDGAAELQTCTAATTCQAGLAGIGPGELEAPTFIAVDNAPGGEGDLYVADLGQFGESPKNLVTKFDEDGNLVTSWGDGGQLDGSTTIAAGTGNLTNGSTTIADLTSSKAPFQLGQSITGAGIPAETFVAAVGSGTLTISRLATATGTSVPLTSGSTLGRPAGLAVDSTGNLWVYTGGTLGALGNHLYEFERDDAFLKSAQEPRSAYSPQGIVVDDSGGSYLANGALTVTKLSASGGFLGTVYKSPTQSITSIAIGQTEDLYIDEGGRLQDISSKCQPTTTSTLGCTPVQTFGSPQLDQAAGLAVGPDGTLYVANTAADQIAVFDVSLEATIAAPTEVKATTATLQGEVDPRTGGDVTRCFFRLGATASYGRNLPCLDAAGEEVGTAAKPITGATPVHADAAGLEGGSAYHYTLRAFNAAEEEVTSEDESFETLPIPVITGAATKEVTAGSATVEAQVDPEGPPVTSCLVQWGTSTAYGNTLPCEPPTLPAGTAPLPVSAHLEVLSADTTYHWRVVATDHCNPAEPAEVCTATGADATFVFATKNPGSPAGSCLNEALRQANGSLALPDCRAYELVTPPQKNGALFHEILNGIAPSLSAAGSRLIASSLQCFGGSQSCTGDRNSKGPPFEFTRTGSGWVTTPLAPPASEFETNSIWGYSAETGWVLASSPVSPGSTDEFYARTPDGIMEAIGPLGQGITVIEGGVQLATGDLSRVLYEFHQSTYEYAGRGATAPLLVGVTGTTGSTDLVSTCGIEIGQGKTEYLFEALSADGRTVYFAAEGGPGCFGSGENAATPVPAGQVWARIDGEGAGARSVDISAPACGTGAAADEKGCRESPAANANFEGASEDGKEAYFSSTQQLTDDATQGSANLYLYADPQQDPEPTGDHLIDVSAGDVSGLGPDVQGVMAVSADGTHVYFVAGGVLAGPNAEGEVPEEGADNLYLYQRDSSVPAGHTSFIAALPGHPAVQGEFDESSEWTGSGTGGTTGIQGGRQPNVTPDGRFLLFTSSGALTPDARSGPQTPTQVYRYDAASGRLLRVSIGQDGFNDDGNLGTGYADVAGVEQNVIGPVRRDPSMSGDGSRVFFRSPVALTPGALDDVSIDGGRQNLHLAKNIYEWQAPDTGECHEASGCVSLISDGEDATKTLASSSVELLGTDISGEDVFFTTTDPLVAADTDTGYDIYDARAGGGFAPPPAPTVCQGDTCKGQGTQAASEQGPATSAFSGAEEGPTHAVRPRCRKGFVKKGNRCVKRSKHRKKHHRKHDHANHGHGGKK